MIRKVSNGSQMTNFLQSSYIQPPHSFRYIPKKESKIEFQDLD